MASESDRDRDVTPLKAGRQFYTTATEVLLTGVAVIIPMVVTVYVLMILLSFVQEALQPVIEILQLSGVIGLLERSELIAFLIEVGLYSDVIGFLSELIAIAVLVGLVVAVGLFAYHPMGERVVGYFDFFIAAIPGVGTVYKSFRRMGDIMVDDDVENFQEVKLVELLSADTFVIGFKVGDSPTAVAAATDDDVVTMFIPFAPNPVTGGFLSYVPEDRLVDVDMTVEEGVRNVITSGVAGLESDRNSVDVSVADIQRFVEGDGSISSKLLDDSSAVDDSKADSPDDRSALFRTDGED